MLFWIQDFCVVCLVIQRYSVLLFNIKQTVQDYLDQLDSSITKPCTDERQNVMDCLITAVEVHFLLVLLRFKLLTSSCSLSRLAVIALYSLCRTPTFTVRFLLSALSCSRSSLRSLHWVCRTTFSFVRLLELVFSLSRSPLRALHWLCRSFTSFVRKLELIFSWTRSSLRASLSTVRLLIRFSHFVSRLPIALESATRLRTDETFSSEHSCRVKLFK